MKKQNELFDSNVAFISYMQQTAGEVLNRLIPDNSEIILLDYPNTTNVGDSLIWLGEVAYLNSRGLKVTYICDTRNYNFEKLKQKVNANTIVLMHGGGNFGTIWKEIHDFRLRVLKELKNVPIIQLPQTIHFDNQQKVDEVNEAIMQHGQYTLIVRSQYCYDFAKANLSTATYLCPDMAFFIGPVQSQLRANFPCFAIARTDHETTGALSSVLENMRNEFSIKIADWLDPDLSERLMHRIEMHTGLVRGVIDQHNMLLLKLWNTLSMMRLRRGVALLGQGNVIVTDRLHVHILSILLGKPHVIVDNNYGKIKHFYDTWTYRCTFHRYAAKPSEVPVRFKELLDNHVNATVRYAQ